MHSPALTNTRMASRTDVLGTLRGQKIKIEGLESAFAGWPFKVNAAVDQVRKDVDTRLRSLFPRHPKLKKLLLGDYGLFGATWWPCASVERLHIATLLSVWLFMWDDEIDLDDGDYWIDLELAQEYRSQTLKFVRNRLRLDHSEVLYTTTNAVINSFDIIGEELQRSCSFEQRRTFMTELSFFMEKSEIEQRLRQRERLINIDEYWQFRLGTSAVRVVLCLNEYCNQTVLPAQVMQDEEMTKLWDLTNANICYVNDLLSVRKELAQGSAESLIPILYLSTGSSQAAADQVLDAVRSTVAEFDVTASRLLQHFDDETHELVTALTEFVNGCRYYCTGNLSWSLSTGRYGVHQALGQKEIIIQL